MGTSMRQSVDFLLETLQARKGWDDIFKVPKKKRKLPTKNTLSSKVILQKLRRDKDFPRQEES